MRLLSIILIITATASISNAMKAISTKGNRTLIDLEGEDVQVGDRLAARNSEGKAKALLQIKQIKNGKAVGLVLKGAMSEEYTLNKLATKNSNNQRKTSKKSQEHGAWGLTAGYSINNMTVKPSASSSVSMTGNSFSASGFYQAHLDGNISARFLLGYEGLDVSGSSASCSNNNCSMKLGYLGVQALVRYSYLNNYSLQAWIGAGLGFLFAVSKSSNVIDTAKISTNQTILGSLGLDFKLDQNSFIPLQVDYALYPTTNTSSANQMILRLGWGTNF